ncbi:MAG: histone deacetylase family protein, partial [Pelagibacterales bacterium]|nr:histone deacetylase family protein [Pelagibacterales bacterium]
MKTGIITTDTYLNHNTGSDHPERADRVTVIIDHLKKLKPKNLIWEKPKKYDLKYLQFAHDKSYLKNVNDSFPKQGVNFLDGDTILSPGSKDATKDAVGS